MASDPIYSTAHRLRLVAVVYERHRRLMAHAVRILAQYGAAAPVAADLQPAPARGLWSRVRSLLGRRGTPQVRQLAAPALSVAAADAIALELERATIAPSAGEAHHPAPSNGDPARRSRWG